MEFKKILQIVLEKDELEELIATDEKSKHTRYECFLQYKTAMSLKTFISVQ